MVFKKEDIDENFFEDFNRKHGFIHIGPDLEKLIHEASLKWIEKYKNE
jgi:hypothetical protein